MRTWHAELYDIGTTAVALGAIAIVIALVSSKISDIRWKMGIIGQPATITIPMETVASVENGVHLQAGVKEYFGTEKGVVCINSDTEARILFVKDRLIAEPGVNFCKPASFWRRLWWAAT